MDNSHCSSHTVHVTPPTGRHLVTEEDGYNYIGEFYFPCITYHLKKRSVLLVASLEVLMEERFVHSVNREVYVECEACGVSDMCGMCEGSAWCVLVKCVVC